MSESNYHCHVRTRFSSCGWDFATFNDAMEYARQQLMVVKRDAREMPQYRGQLRDYYATISNPEEDIQIGLYSGYFATH